MGWAKRVLDANQARREIKRRMLKFAEEAPKEVTDQMTASAGEITVAMRMIVPVRSGKLKKSIGYGFKKDMPEGAQMFAHGKFGLHSVFVWAGSAIAYWARWVEFGTADSGPHRIAKGPRKGQMGAGHTATPARPFFWPVWRAWKKEVKKDMRKAYKKVGQRVFGGQS